MKLINKKVLITGAAKRIGRVFSLLIAREGGDVLLHHNHSKNEAAILSKEIRDAGREAIIFQADFSDPDSVENFIDQVFGSYQIDAVINNASVFGNQTWQTTNRENWRLHQTVNLEVPFLISQAFANALDKDRTGKIINVLDWRALKPAEDHFPYTISKAGLAALTRSLALSLAPKISVNGIALGAILPPLDEPNTHAAISGLPIPRWAEISELEETILFLLSGPDYITGEILHLDGGRHLV